MKLYKFKSNPTTIVSITGNYVQVEWAACMDLGVPSIRGLYLLDENNLIPLTDSEAEAIITKINNWKANEN